MNNERLGHDVANLSCADSARRSILKDDLHLTPQLSELTLTHGRYFALFELN